MKGPLQIIAIGLILILSQCDFNQNGPIQKLTDEVKDVNNKISQVDKKVDKLEAEVKENKSGQKSEELSMPGKSDTTKLEDVVSKINELEKRIDKLVTRVTDLEKQKEVKKVTHKKRRRSRTSLRSEIYTLKRQLRQNVAVSQTLIRQLSGTNRVTPTKTGTYRVYVGAFKSHTNAVNRRNHVSSLGVPAIILGKTKVTTKAVDKEYWDNYYNGYGYASTYNEGEHYPSDYYDYNYNGTHDDHYLNKGYTTYRTTTSYLHRVASKYRYNFNDAARLANYLMSKGYEAYVRKVK